MFRVFQILSFVAVLWISGVVCEDCLSLDETWGTADPTKIMFCDLTTNQAEATNCRNGYGFKNNGTLAGCVRWEEWDDGCILKNNLPKIDSCEGANSVSPQPVQGDPTAYYLCSSSSPKPVVLHCAENKGFVAYGGYLGCLPWALWREVTGCTY